MSTTTITGAEHLPSIRTSDRHLSIKSSTSHAMAIPVEHFPSIQGEATVEKSKNVQSPEDITPSDQDTFDELWQPRKPNHVIRQNGHINGIGRHKSRKSISEAIDSIRARRGSVSANAQELAAALKAPVSYKLVILCIIWYTTSALTNTSSKSILIAFPKPVTLTLAQFAFVSIWCLVSAYLAAIYPALKTAVPALRHGIRYPSAEIMLTALPLAIFQLAGHILSTTATSKIPVSLVHTIKGLSPLFTVLAYRVVFRIRYARATYLSLIPLTLGVMLACSAGFSTNFVGIACAFCAALVFVTQNIFSKKLFNEAARAEADGQTHNTRKLDKLNLLCYCSAMAFFLTAPIWLLTEGFPLIRDVLHDGVIGLSDKKGALDHGPLLLEFVFNGIFHFGQNIMAFVLLSMVSPVSYSVASLIKRVFVIVIAVVWFGSSTTPVQAFGIALTFLGLYLYDRTSHEDSADRRANADHFKTREALLPLNIDNKDWNLNGHVHAPRTSIGNKIYEGAGGYLKSFYGDNRKENDNETHPRPRSNSLTNGWLPPGTKQEGTWELVDSRPKS